jgi:isopentenyl diphosphate isomerase/L-lactate dehydrogenase-like FMN-dependent dehydrogenase
MTDDRAIGNTVRRRLLRYLLASPVLAGAGPMLAAVADADDKLIEKVEDALNVFDFEALARQRLPPAHWGYLATGTDSDGTIRANREGFDHYALRVRRMIDVTTVDMSMALFGANYASPIGLSPVSSLQAFHPEGEVGAAHAARAGNHLQILSTLTSRRIEDVNAARGASVWFQLYTTDQWDVTTGLLKHAQAAGCSVAAVTVDLNGGSNRETLARFRRVDTRDCTLCHKTEPGGTQRLQDKSMFAGIDTSKVRNVTSPAMTWETVRRMRDVWRGKLLIKGVVTKEDGELAVRHGFDGVIVSNHGGRAEDSGRASIDSLSEVVDGTRRKIPVLVDGGFRRGTDIFKALAIGATAVCVGRPYVWGLASFGQQGVEAVLGILRRELAMVMRQVGTRNLAEITRAAVTTKA